MAHTVTFHQEHKLVRVTADGSENMPVVLESMRAVRTDPRFQPDYGILCDFRNQGFVPNGAEAFGICTVLGSFFPAQRFAFVISDPIASVAQRKIIAGAQSKVSAMIFGDISAAETWLMGEPRNAASASCARN